MSDFLGDLRNLLRQASIPDEAEEPTQPTATLCPICRQVTIDAGGDVCDACDAVVVAVVRRFYVPWNRFSPVTYAEVMSDRRYWRGGSYVDDCRHELERAGF